MLIRLPVCRQLGMLASGFAVLLVVGCDGGGPATTPTQKPATQGPPPVESAVSMQGRPRPPDGPIAREAAITPAVAATPAIPATPLVPPQPVNSPAEPAAPVDSLGIGDAAPELAIATWLTGEPLDGFPEGSVTVVEFWATWCGPCRTSMPHISELQEQYGETVRFVGVTREEQDVVEEFLGQEQSEGKTWQEAITYRLAIDEADTTNTAYMRAAGQNGIPCAFIVGKDGHVEWIGHPMQIDDPLAAVVNDSYDREAAVAEFVASQRLKEMQRELMTLRREERWDEALAILDQLQEEMGAVPGLMSMRLQMLSAAGRGEEASAVRGELMDAAWDSSMALNELAWTTAIGESPSAADLDVALKAATRAAELTDEADGSILDTLARVFFVMGDVDRAIEWQEKAVERSDGDASIERALEEYRAAKEAAGSGEQPSVGDAEVSS
jgi:thiol-disulfide isomerase/thioredoxin